MPSSGHLAADDDQGSAVQVDQLEYLLDIALVSECTISRKPVFLLRRK